jgi:MFS transporter, DHA2 family, multidrug resistance protein
LSIIGGIALGIVFVRRQAKLVDPFIDLRLFRIRAFSVSLAVYGLGIFIVFGGFLFLPQYFQLVLGLSPLEAGLWTLPWALGFVVGSNVTPMIARRIPPATLMATGLALAAVGFAVFTQVDTGSSLGAIVAGSIIFSLGTSPLFTLTNDLIIGSAPPERAGAAAGISETAAELRGALGIAVFGSVGVAVYRGGIDIPAGVPAGAAETARDTLGGAIDIAAELPTGVASALIEAARAAFTQGVQIGAAISTLGSVGLAIFVFLTLRSIRAGGDLEDGPSSDAGAGRPASGEVDDLLEPATPDS